MTNRRGRGGGGFVMKGITELILYGTRLLLLLLLLLILSSVTAVVNITDMTGNKTL